jgi:hypothetical protein
MPTFDQNVFDIATFDALFGIPSLFKVEVERGFRQIVSGQAVVITAFIVNRSNPRKPYLFNPDNGVQITIYNPDMSIKVQNAPMVIIETGTFQYRHQTGILMDELVFDSNTFDIITNDQLGIHTASFTAQDGNMYLRTPKHEIYEVI